MKAMISVSSKYYYYKRMSFISQPEIKFICDGISQGVRVDGRRNNQYRDIELQVNVLQQSNGSARVRFVNGGTDVLASVKMEVSHVEDDFKLEDQVVVSITYSASACLEYRSRAMEAEGDLLAERVRTILTSPGSMDLSELIIIPKLFSWKLYIDCEVYDDSGNVFDLIMLAVFSALKTTRLPITTAIKNVEQEEKDFEIDADSTHFKRLSSVSIPISVTMSTICGNAVVDITEKEEWCVDSEVIICVNRRKEIVSVCNQRGKINSQALLGFLQVASDKSEELFKLVENAVEKDDMKWTSSEEPTKRGLFVSLVC